MGRAPAPVLRSAPETRPATRDTVTFPATAFPAKQPAMPECDRFLQGLRPGKPRPRRNSAKRSRCYAPRCVEVVLQSTDSRLSRMGDSKVLQQGRQRLFCLSRDTTCWHHLSASVRSSVCGGRPCDPADALRGACGPSASTWKRCFPSSLPL